MAEVESWLVRSFPELLHRLHVDLFQAPDTLFRDGDGFARSSAFLRLLGDPQDTIPVVHIAGTAGKGTTAYQIARGLRSMGLAVGLHVSPHVYDIRERWQIDDEMISEEVAVRLFNELVPALLQLAAQSHGAPTFFEVTTAMAFLVFADLDIAVIETGLGGLYDTTNTITRADKIAVITSIGLDHEAVLGKTLEEIAFQKAGILPFGGMGLVLAPREPEVLRVVERVARERRCELQVVEPGDGEVAHVAVASALSRAVLAEVARRRCVPPPSDPATPDLPGRFETWTSPEGRRAVLDGAHNRMKLEALIQRFDAEVGGPVTWVFGCRRDKKVVQILEAIHSRGGPLAVVQFDIPSGDVPGDTSIPAEELVQLGKSVDEQLDISAAGSVEEALDAALTNTGTVVVCGSFHLLADARRALSGRRWRQIRAG